MSMMGKVSIVGAGPGDPELLTLKALKRIESADVIMYDRLVNKEILLCARHDTILVYCGKKPGEHAMSQNVINETMINYALTGYHVVRLKGGDPFVFGRGGEEALELAAYNIPYEIVPGITSAIGASASAGIPLTHRGVAASFACVTGSRCHGEQSPVRWDLLAHSVDTLVIYMGVRELKFIREELMKYGKNPATPVALIEQGTNKKERTFTGTLSDIHLIAAAVNLTNPALIIIGEVVEIQEQLIAIERKASSLAHLIV
jgi:uroporphyrin-III C-methyltransferase